MNLEYTIYEHFTPHILKLKKEVEELEEILHIQHEQPLEDDGAHCEDDVED